MTDLEHKDNVRNREDSSAQGSQCENLTHSFLFSSGFISVDDLGRVLVLSVPQFRKKEVLLSSTYHLKQDSAYIDISINVCKDTTGQVTDVSASPIRSKQDDKEFVSNLNNCNASGEKTLAGCILDSPISKPKSNGGESIGNSPQDRAPMVFADGNNDDPIEVEFSPRLTNFIKSGIVPESPVIGSGMYPLLLNACPLNSYTNSYI